MLHHHTTQCRNITGIRFLSPLFICSAYYVAQCVILTAQHTTTAHHPLLHSMLLGQHIPEEPINKCQCYYTTIHCYTPPNYYTLCSFGNTYQKRRVVVGWRVVVVCCIVTLVFIYCHFWYVLSNEPRV